MDRNEKEICLHLGTLDQQEMISVDDNQMTSFPTLEQKPQMWLGLLWATLNFVLPLEDSGVKLLSKEISL